MYFRGQCQGKAFLFHFLINLNEFTLPTQLNMLKRVNKHIQIQNSGLAHILKRANQSVQRSNKSLRQNHF
jgi:hypothetical protein